MNNWILLEKSVTYVPMHVARTTGSIDVIDLFSAPPKFIDSLKDIFAVEGESVSFSVVVAGSPDPEILWFVYLPGYSCRTLPYLLFRLSLSLGCSYLTFWLCQIRVTSTSQLSRKTLIGDFTRVFICIGLVQKIVDGNQAERVSSSIRA